VSIISFFALAILGSVIFVSFCLRHPVDLVAADYYEQEIRYQGQIDRIRQTQSLAASAAAKYDPQTRTITVSLPPDQAQGQASGTIHLYRPSTERQDRQIPLAPGTDGVQTIDARDLLPGLWKVRVSWTVGRQEYYLDQRIVVEHARS
jgi:nitrogen fixation protein FixH